MDQTATLKKIDLTFASAFNKPIHATYAGEPVRVSHVGDAEGMSPVFLVIDSQGQSAWVKQSEVTITDPDYLPVSEMSGSRTGLRSTSTSGTTSSSPAGSR